MAITTFFRPVVDTLQAYVSAPTIDDCALALGVAPSRIIKLDAGENTYVEADTQIDLQTLSLGRYPDPGARALRQRLAEYCEVDATMITVTNGSDEAIDLLCRLFLDRGDALVDFPPTFPMYRVFATLQGARVIEVPRAVDFTLVSDQAAAALMQAKLAFIATPNNPTGTAIPRLQIEQLLQTGRPVVVDEAYIEYGGRTVVPLLSRYDNLIVIRTLSKWAGLAGIRIGYIIAAPRVIAAIDKIKPPYNTNTISQAIACQILDNRRVILEKISQAKKRRRWLLAQLRRIPTLKVTASQGATIIVQSNALTAVEMCSQLQKQGILVRNCASSYLPEAIRVNLGTRAELETLIAALQAIIRAV